MKGMRCALTPALAQPTRKAATRASSQAERQPVGKDLRERTLAHGHLGLLDRIRGTMKGERPSRKVDERVGGAGVPVARLADASRIEEGTRAERVGIAVPDMADPLAARRKERRHVGVSGAAVRGPRERERRGRRAVARHVLPERNAEAAAAE